MYRILYVDDEPGFLELGKAYLEAAQDFSVDTETDGRRALATIAAGRYDAVVSDYMMPEMDGIELLKEVRQQFGDIPFILFTGRGREEIVIQAINNGVDFYLQKGGDPQALFAELAHKIHQAVNRKRAQEERDQTEQNFRNLVNNAPDAIFIIVRDRFRYANTAALRLLGAPDTGSVLGTNPLDHIHPSFHASIRERIADLTIRIRPVRIQDEVYMKIDGTPVDVSVSAVPFQFHGEHGALLIVRDITDRKRAETELRAAYEQIAAAEEQLRQQFGELEQKEQDIRRSEESYRGLFNSIPQAICIRDADGKFIDVNEGAVAMYGYSREEFTGSTPAFLSAPGKNDPAAIGAMMKKAFDGGPQQFVFWAQKKDRTVFKMDVRVYRSIYFGRDVLITIGTDLTGIPG